MPQLQSGCITVLQSRLSGERSNSDAKEACNFSRLSRYGYLDRSMYVSCYITSEHILK